MRRLSKILKRFSHRSPRAAAPPSTRRLHLEPLEIRRLLTGGDLPTGSRGWETIPGVIRNDGVESFVLEVDSNGPVSSVTLSSLSWSILYPGGASVVTLHDDGQGVDRVAGDNLWTAGPFRWNTAAPLTQFYQGDPDSPEGLSEDTVGSLEIRETDGTTSKFLLGPQVGILQSDIPNTTITQLSPSIAVSPHLINITTGTHETQTAIHSLGGNLRNLTRPIYEVLPDAYDSFMFFSMDKVETTPRSTEPNFNAGMHSTIQAQFHGHRNNGYL